MHPNFRVVGFTEQATQLATGMRLGVTERSCILQHGKLSVDSFDQQFDRGTSNVYPHLVKLAMEDQP